MEYQILSSNITNEKYTALIEVKTLMANKKLQNYYDYIIICNHCGTVKSVRRKQFDKYTICRECNINKSHDSMLGEHGIYEVLSFSHANSRRALFYSCKCKLCNKLSIVQKRDIEINQRCSRCNEQTDDSITLIYYKKYLNEALRRNLTFDLSYEEFKNLVTSNCYYCGDSPQYSKNLTKYYNKSKDRGSIYFNGVDRKNSLIGYTTDNCVSCCSVCNRMKNNFTEDLFKDKIVKIYNNLDLSSTTIPYGSTSEANADGSAEHPIKDGDIV